MTDLPMPVTVMMSRLAAPGRDAELATWAEDLGATASTFPGYLGHRVRDAEPGSSEVVIGLTFATSEDLIRWERSAERAAMLGDGLALTRGDPVPVTLDVLHGAPGGSAPHAPRQSAALTALLVWIGLFPPALALNVVLEPHTGAWPVWLRTLALTLVLVPTVVFVSVPLLNRAVTALRERLGQHEDPMVAPGP